MREVFRRIYYLLNRRKLERELQSDIEFHREMLSAESRNDFGNPTLMRERAREAWGWGWLDRLSQDLRFGARLLRKSPGLVFTAVTVLALGIGVNVTAFNVVDIMFFKPLRVRDPLSLVGFAAKSPNSYTAVVPYPAALFYAQQTQALSAVLMQTNTRMTLTEEENSQVHAGLVSANYFSELGATAAYGRLFDPRTDDKPDGPPVAVLGYGFWQSHFGGDPTVVGKVIRLNQHPATIIGVIPFNFIGLDPEHGETDDVWLIISRFAYFVPETRLLTSFDSNDSGIHMTARLKRGVTLKAAAAALQPLSQELVRQHPDSLPKGLTLLLFPGGYATHLDPGDGFYPMFGLFATLVLLILCAACGNLGNLFLGHAITREREISIRMALGATRKRIVRQLMTESLMLALLGSGAGLFLSWAVSRPLVGWLGGPSRLDLSPDWRTILFAFGAGALASVLFGLSPARQAVRASRRSSRARTVFMATQIAASCVLLAISALLVRGLYRATTFDPGFDYVRVITVDPQLYEHGYDSGKANQFTQDLLSRLRQVPGIEAASVVTIAPLGNRASFMRAHDDIKVNIHRNQISPQYFQTMGIPLLRGRDFTRDDKDVVVVSESCARNVWPGKDPLQQTWKSGGKQYSVVGVAGNARSTALRNGDDAVIYFPMDDSKVNSAVVLVRTSLEPQALTRNLASLVRTVDPALSPHVESLKTTLADRLSDSQKITGVVGFMGTLALVLAVVGLYGVVAYNVTQKTREIGIRIALGAMPGHIVRSVVENFLLPLSIALAAGLGLSLVLSLVLREYLYGLSNFDPFSYAAAIVLLGSVGSVAALLPARRALQVDPMVALRCE
jgi:predicted permease